MEIYSHIDKFCKSRKWKKKKKKRQVSEKLVAVELLSIVWRLNCEISSHSSEGCFRFKILTHDLQEIWIF